MNRWPYRIGLVLFLTVCSALVACGQDAEEAKDKDAAQKPADATHTVKPERLRIEVNLTGVFEATRTWPIVLHPNNWSNFTVVKAVNHGQRVKKGDQLVWLDMSKIDEQLQDMQYALELGKLSRRLALKEQELLEKTVPLDLKSAERDKRIADEDLAYFMKTDRDFQIESAKYSLKSSQQSLEYAMEELKQLEEMYKADDLTEETEEIVLKRARNDVERAKFYLKSSELRNKQTIETELPREEQQLVDAAQRADLAAAKATASLPVSLEKKKVELEEKRLSDARAQQEWEELRDDRAMMEVKSPGDGYVYYGQCTRGSWASVESMSSQLTEGGKLSPNSVFMTVVAPRPLRIRVDVPEKELHRLKTNARGKAVPDGYPEMELPVTCAGVSPFPIGKGTFDGTFDVALSDDARPIVPGMNCKLTLVVYDKKDALTVPADAVFEDAANGQRDLVYVKKADGTPEKRKVVVGQKTDSKWEIVRGLSANEEILLKQPETP